MFLNPLMLAGLGGAVLPVVLHLLNRARYRTRDWGAMMFLPGAEGRQERSAKIRQLLLLLMRMAIVALLAVALARPVAGAGWTAMATNGHCCAVILVDTSGSMGYDEGNGPRIDSARRAALAVLAGLDRADEINLLPLGDGDLADTPPPVDLQTAASRIADLRVTDGHADMTQGLTAAARVFRRSNAANRLLVIICDRQASNWKNLDENFAAAWHQSLEDAGARTSHRPHGEDAIDLIPKFVVISVGSEGCENVAVDRVVPPAPPVVRDVPVPVDVTVHNYGTEAVTALPLSVRVARAKATFRTTVDLAAGASATITLTPRFSTLGAQVLHARIGPDAHVPGNLMFDDQLDAVVNVVNPLDVGIITGEQVGPTALRQADALRFALMPYKSANEAGPDLAHVTIINPQDNWPDNLADFRVLILADVPELDEEQASRIEQFVFDGGGLLVTPGDLLLPQEYNDSLYLDGEGLLPASVAPATQPSIPTAIIPTDTNHPALAFLHGNTQATLSATASRYLPVQASSGEAHVIARFADGAPMLLERPFGRGRVLMTTTTLGGSWSTLLRSSSFLPLVQSAVRYLASGGEDQQTLIVHQPIEAHFPTTVADRGGIALPDDSYETLDLIPGDQTKLARFTDTNLPGQYWVSAHMPDGQPDKVETFIVQPTRDESDLTPLTLERWTQLSGWLGFTRMDAQSANQAAAMVQRRNGRELWLVLAACVVLLMLGESMISRWMSGEG